MTTVLAPAPVRPSTRWSWPRVLWIAGAVLLVTMVVHVVAMVVTGDAVVGPVSLRKPATFAETGWLLAWSTALILPAVRARPWQRHVVGASVVIFGVVETAVIGIQAWRGVPSHYNFSTPLDTALMRGAAAGTAGVFVVGMVVLLVAALRSRSTGADVRLGVVGGVVVTLIGGAVGMLMISNNSGVYQGSVGSGFGRTGAYLGPDAATVGPEYLLIRPATLGGDLVVPHAIGVHGLVLLAVPALLATRTARTAAQRLGLAVASATGVAAALAILLVHALRGQPLVALHPVALAVLAMCATTIGVVVIRSLPIQLSRSHDREGEPS